MFIPDQSGALEFRMGGGLLHLRFQFGDTFLHSVTDFILRHTEGLLILSSVRLQLPLFRPARGLGNDIVPRLYSF